MLGEASVFLTHCGMNSVSESIWCGVPMVLAPQQSEEAAVARRAAELGAGLRLERRGPAGCGAGGGAALGAPRPGGLRSWGRGCAWSAAARRAAELGAGLRLERRGPAGCGAGGGAALGAPRP
ncbi:hypothetical protein NE457_21400, partial [Flavonifractor plautii]|nr:hypothetical protein [Flavonifractor plautii]